MEKNLLLLRILHRIQGEESEMMEFNPNLPPFVKAFLRGISNPQL